MAIRTLLCLSALASAKAFVSVPAQEAAEQAVLDAFNQFGTLFILEDIDGMVELFNEGAHGTITDQVGLKLTTYDGLEGMRQLILDDYEFIGDDITGYNLPTMDIFVDLEEGARVVHYTAVVPAIAETRPFRVGNVLYDDKYKMLVLNFIA